MKIAILTPTFCHFSGIDRLVEIKAKEFSEKGHQVTIFTLHATLDSKYAKIVKMGLPKNSTIERLYRLLFFLDISTVSRYAKKISKFDIAISHLYPMNILASKAKRINPKLTYVYHNAGVGIVNTYSFLEQSYLQIFNYLTNKSLSNVDKTISISDFLRVQLKKETGIDGKVEYIPIDKKRFNKGVKSGDIRKKYNLKTEPVFLYVGRLSPHKGVHLLIHAFNKILPKFPDAKLILVGKPTFPKYQLKLKKIVKKNVIFAGFVDDVDLPKYYAVSNVYVTASLWEGFDMPIVEAEYSGKPSVAFDVGSHKEVLKKGKLVKMGDIAAFANAMIKTYTKFKS